MLFLGFISGLTNRFPGKWAQTTKNPSSLARNQSWLGFHHREPFSVDSVFQNTWMHIHLCIYTYHIHTPYMSPGLPQRAQGCPAPGLGPGPGQPWAAVGGLGLVRCMYLVCIYAWLYMYTYFCRHFLSFLAICYYLVYLVLFGAIHRLYLLLFVAISK